MSPSVVSDQSLEKAGINLDIDVVKARVEKILSDELYWFPVRHHSPNVALHLKSVIQERKPKVIFIEGPSQATDLIPFLIDSKTKPPVAIYTSFRDDQNVLNLAGIVSPAEDIAPVFPAWYPFLQYSPEYLAMKMAKESGAKVFFIDLPHYARIKPHVSASTELSVGRSPAAKGEEQPRDQGDKDEPDGEEQTGSENADAGDGVESVAGDNANLPAAEKTDEEREIEKELEFGSEHLIIESQFYQQLASVAGYRSFDEAWDSLFEMRKFENSEEFRREIASFCCASRATTIRQRMENDGTTERERFMMLSIRNHLKTLGLKPSEAMVVCGGFHLFLDQADTTPPPPIHQGTVYNTIVPYSFFQVSELSGYAAGTRAPQFYQRVWELSMANRPQDIVVEHIVSVLTEARKKGQILSSADAIAVSQHTEMLSRLRGRAMPVLDDLHDALVTCCCKGDPKEEGTVLFRAMDAADIGSSIGKVTSALGQLPVVKDFYTNMEALDLNEVLGKEKRLTVETDKRELTDARRSVFFHRLQFLKVPVCGLAQAPSGDFSTGQIFKEKWHLKWSPAVEASLIDLNLYGDTIEAAALSRLRKALKDDENSAGETSLHLVRAIDMDLPDLIRATEEALSHAIDNDTRFVSLTRALTSLMVLDRYFVYRNLRHGLLNELIVRCYDRACFAILDVVSVPEDQQEIVVASLVSLAETAQQGDKQGLDRNLFSEHVLGAAKTTTVPFLRGALMGILSELRQIDPIELANEVRALAKAPVEVMVTAGDFLDGIMAVSRTSIMLGAESLVQAIDELLHASEWNPFLTMLPKMRAAFERMHSSHRDSLSTRVAQLYGLKEGQSITELRISASAAVTVALIDKQVATIMKEWNLG